MSLDPANTLNPTKEPIVPANPDHLTMYVSGPTVYNFARMGNARPPGSLDAFEAALEDDLNFSNAIAELFQLAQAARQSETPADRASHKLPLSEVGSLPGLLQQDPAVWLRRSEEGDDTSRIQRMVEAHFASQTASDFGNACQIRAELDALEVTFEDYANGSAWRRTG